MPDASEAIAYSINLKDEGYDFSHSLARNHSQHSSTDQLIPSLSVPQSYDPYGHNCFSAIAKLPSQGDDENFTNTNTYDNNGTEQEWNV